MHVSQTQNIWIRALYDPDTSNDNDAVTGLGSVGLSAVGSTVSYTIDKKIWQRYAVCSNDLLMSMLMLFWSNPAAYQTYVVQRTLRVQEKINVRCHDKREIKNINMTHYANGVPVRTQEDCAEEEIL